MDILRSSPSSAQQFILQPFFEMASELAMKQASEPIPMQEDSRSPKQEAAGSFESASQFGSSNAVEATTPTSTSVIPFNITAEELENQVLGLEKNIRAQKESSVNAKTAITFEQLRQIHAIGKILGPAKDAFYDRICRAADIQRASLKNRLKQNKEKFIQKNGGVDLPGGLAAIIRTYAQKANGSSALGGSQPAQPPQQEVAIDYLQMMEPLAQFSTVANQLSNGLFSPGLNGFNPLSNLLLDQSSANANAAAVEPPLSAEERALQERAKIPAQRMLQLLQLGFSFDEVKQVNDLFHSFSELAQKEKITNVREQFSNFLSTNSSESFRLVSSAYNMLEMGYTTAAINPALNLERRKRQASACDGDETANGSDVKRVCYEDDEASNQ